MKARKSLKKIFRKISPFLYVNGQEFLKKHLTRKLLIRKPVYKALWSQYSGAMTVDRFNWFTYYDEKLNFLFHRIPKVANSSLTASLSKLADSNYDFINSDMSQQEKRNVKTSTLHASEISNEEILNLTKIFKFAFVRNPYARFLSAYLSKVEDRDISKSNEFNIKHKEFLETFSRDKSFENFARLLAADETLLYSKVDFIPQVDFLLLKPEEYDFIGRFENINNDFTYVANKILSNSLTYAILKEDPAHQTSADKKLKQYYTSYTKGLVKDLYKKDFEMLGYEY